MDCAEFSLFKIVSFLGKEVKKKKLQVLVDGMLKASINLISLFNPFVDSFAL